MVRRAVLYCVQCSPTAPTCLSSPPPPTLCEGPSSHCLTTRWPWSWWKVMIMVVLPFIRGHFWIVWPQGQYCDADGDAFLDFDWMADLSNTSPREYQARDPGKKRKRQHLTFRHLPNYHLHIRLILRRGKALKLNFLYWSSLIFACWAKLKRQNISIFSISNLGWHVPHFVSAPICYKFKFSDSKLPHNTMSHHIKSHYKGKSTTMRWQCKTYISGEGVP